MHSHIHSGKDENRKQTLNIQFFPKLPEKTVVLKLQKKTVVPELQKQTVVLELHERTVRDSNQES